MFKARCHPLKKWLIIGVYSPPTHQSSSIIISCICQKNIRRCSIIAQKSGRNDGPAASILREKDPISSRTVGARTSRSRLPYLSSENDGFSWWMGFLHQELRFSSAKAIKIHQKTMFSGEQGITCVVFSPAPQLRGKNCELFMPFVDRSQSLQLLVLVAMENHHFQWENPL